MEYNDTNLLKLDAQGKSLNEIALALHVTRNAVKGRLSRLKAKGVPVFDRRGRKRPKRTKEERAKAKVAEPQSTAAPKTKRPPNRNTFWMDKSKPQLSKAEMRDMLRMAVENTK